MVYSAFFSIFNNTFFKDFFPFFNSPMQKPRVLYSGYTYTYTPLVALAVFPLVKLSHHAAKLR